MLPRTSSLKNKQQPVAKDENVRKEAQAEEDVKTVQPMGNEAANVELMEQMLKDANDDISLDLGSSNNIVNENFRSGGSKKGSSYSASSSSL